MKHMRTPRDHDDGESSRHSVMYEDATAGVAWDQCMLQPHTGYTQGRLR